MKTKQNLREKEAQLDKFEKCFKDYARQEGILAYKVGQMSPEDLYHFVNMATVRYQSERFCEYVLHPLGEIEENQCAYTFLHTRDYIRQIVAEGETTWPLPEFADELRQFAQMQALAGWHHVHCFN